LTLQCIAFYLHSEDAEVPMGVRSNFSWVGQHRHFAYPFSGFWRCNTNGRSQNAFSFIHHKENAPCYGNSHRNALLWQQ